MKTFFEALLVGLFIAGCATTPLSEYNQTLDKYSYHTQQYDGLYNTLEAEGTLLNSKVIAAQTHAQAEMYQWSEETRKKEASDFSARSQTETQVFVTFFTPERKLNELNKSQTLWKIYLDANGKRFEGKAEKVKLLNQEITKLYPYHNQWANPYILKFQVPLKEVERFQSRITLTGPIGTATLNFEPVITQTVITQ